jgi:hypothetical protein
MSIDLDKWAAEHNGLHLQGCTKKLGDCIDKACTKVWTINPCPGVDPPTKEWKAAHPKEYKEIVKEVEQQAQAEQKQKEAWQQANAAENLMQQQPPSQSPFLNASSPPNDCVNKSCSLRYERDSGGFKTGFIVKSDGTNITMGDLCDGTCQEQILNNMHASTQPQQPQIQTQAQQPQQTQQPQSQVHPNDYTFLWFLLGLFVAFIVIARILATIIGWIVAPIAAPIIREIKRKSE